MMRLPSVLLRTGALALLLLFSLTLLLRARERPSRSTFLQQAVRSQIQHGVLLSLDDDSEVLSSNDSYRDVGSGPKSNLHFSPLLDCPIDVNAQIQHIRLPYHHLNISFLPPGQESLSISRLFNPTILPLPSWSNSGSYLIVSRVVTEGLHQESLDLPCRPLSPFELKLKPFHPALDPVQPKMRKFLAHWGDYAARLKL